MYLSCWADMALAPKTLTSAATTAIICMRVLFSTISSLVEFGGLGFFPAGAWYGYVNRTRQDGGLLRHHASGDQLVPLYLGIRQYRGEGCCGSVERPADIVRPDAHGDDCSALDLNLFSRRIAVEHFEIRCVLQDLLKHSSQVGRHEIVLSSLSVRANRITVKGFGSSC